MICLEVSRLPLGKEPSKRLQRVGCEQQRSNPASPQDSADGDFRLQSKVDHTRGWAQKCRRARNSSPAATRGENHPAVLGEFPSERELEGAEAWLSRFGKNLRDRFPFAALDLRIEIEEGAVEPARDAF